MKKIISGEKLEDKMQEAINLLCDTVKVTLGPKGRNVIIDHSDFSPFITNDGVTIAENISSDDQVLNTILEIAKEASINTNENIGDGTTTTLVLLQGIFNECLKYIRKGENPIILKSNLKNSVDRIIQMLDNLKLEETEERKRSLAIISANDENIGNLVNEIFKKVKTKEAININEVNFEELNVSYLQGYFLDITLASSYFLNDELSKNLNNVYLLVINDCLNDIEKISEILNDIIKNNRNLLIVAKDFDEYFIQQIVSLNLSEGLNCYLLKINDYGIHERIIQQDLQVISNAKIVESLNSIKSSNLGFIKSAKISKDLLQVSYDKNKVIEEYIKNIKEDIKKLKDDFELSFYQKRLAMFTSGLANITIGSQTKIECKEKRMRLEDSICVLDSLKNGILPGSGISLLYISENMIIYSNSDKIIKEAFAKPFEQILINSGVDHKKIRNEIFNKRFKYLYNILNEKLEKISNTKVIDSYNVVLNCILNACSIASMLITTNSLVINEYREKKGAMNYYNEI